ncbi:mannosyl-glycoendo-beta-N-acetylglucosaminidase family protein [Clostridium argentinense CDC 2741]|uniref:Mannosyl-glycoendo-beta-N-acetylglucosaminidase family protein n=2 Tax=Clostridium argentinense TaxID=29341 RepID=A0A0C1QYM8_9CLOT|nr:glucosaminidase domain-containing protein [Clostridium argentinense]KIE46157.1 mannosyl-glycoendo-beta-N-acetylglucosaminidase family protein [Clostridium argentinense CDC 2741]
MWGNIVRQRSRMIDTINIGRRKRRKKTNMFGKILFLVMLICILYISINYFIKEDNIILSDSEINLYINAADDVSKGKLQVNWKYLAAIDGVRYKKDFSKVNTENLKELGENFLKKDGTSSKKDAYKLINLEDMLNKLSFNEKEKEKVHKYLTELELIGLASDNLRKDSPYRAFIEELSPKAIELYNKHGILPSITIGQAILESGWGKSDLSVKANNLFGIKADSSWKGESVSMTTSEYYNDVIQDKFRRYKNKTDSLDDYGKFLVENDRYKKNGLFEATQYMGQAKALENAGYSTKQDENGNNIYSNLLINVIKENDLQLIDNKVQSPK